MRKNITAVLTAIVVFVMTITGNTGLSFIDDTLTADVYAAGGRVSLSRTLNSFGIKEIGRPASEGLWTMRVGGKKVFCLNSGKALHTNDYVSGKTSDAINYKNQSLAKVTTYYFGERDGAGGKNLYALCQTYAWAAGKGANKKTAMVQAAAALGISESIAKKIYKEIEATVPYGKVTYYSVTGCKKGGGGSGHQHLIGWSYAPTVPDYGAVFEPYASSAVEEIRLSIEKKDTATGKPIDTATFHIYRDNVLVGKATTKHGIAEYTYTAKYEQKLEPTQDYIYVKNWALLNSAQQKAEKEKGYYSSEAKAMAACINDLKPRVEALLQQLKTKPHQWKVVEVSAPKNHRLSTTSTAIQTESGSTTSLYFNFTNAPVKMTLNLTKKADGDYGTEATLKGAVYGLFAAETIYGTDNKTVAYTTDQQVTTLTTDAAGKASASDLLPGRYILKELEAPLGFKLDETEHSVDLTYGTGNTSVERSITVTDERIMGKIDITKTWGMEEKPYKYVNEKQLKADYVPGLCEHHTAHGADCAYVEAVAGQPCNHVHGASCYTYYTTTNCIHDHDETCYSDGILPAVGETKTADTCTHVCSLDNGCVEYVYDCGQTHAHTQDCIRKTLNCPHVHDAACGYVPKVDAVACDYVCPICGYEDVLVKKLIPITDVFELYDSKNNLVDTIVIDENAHGESKMLPYGSYVLRQTQSTEGFEKVAAMTISINADNQVGTVNYPERLTLDDKPEEAGIMITKIKSIHDDETGIHRTEAEEGAEFEIYAPNGDFIKKIATDKTGVAYSGDLEVYGFGEYTVRQVKGEADYQIIADQKINVVMRRIYYAEFENTYSGPKLRIQKYKQKDTKLPEKGAQFAILDAAYVQATKEELAAMTTPEDRVNYLLDLETATPEAVITTMVTDENGKSVEIFDKWKLQEHPDGFIVFQITGDRGYALAAPAYSNELTAVVENGIHVYSFEAVDAWDEWANITLTKKMTTSATETAFEEGAQFCIRNSMDEIVETKSTDATGTVRFEKLDYDTYQIEQVSGDNRHEMIEPITVTITRHDKHQDVAATAQPIVDEEKPVVFELTKRSAETDILLNGARYELYRVGELANEFITTLVSGSATEKNAAGEDVPVKGMASCELPYGSYMIKEVYPADGYTVDETEIPFILDINSVTYDADGNGTYSIDVKDEPIKGRISMNKTGNIITSFDSTRSVFNTNKTGIPGAVYGLYAKENILKDDGTIVWAAGTLIDRKTTDENGGITFTTTDKDGNETDRFYLGRYYVKEISVPEGFTLDPAEHDVYLTWDNKTQQFDDIRQDVTVPEEEDPIGNNSPDPNREKYVLDIGENVNQVIKNATTVTFTWETAPAGVTPTNIASDGGDGIVYWNSGTDYYISTQKAGQVIYFNAISSYMFSECTSLTEIKFKNVDTSMAVDMSYMFYRCLALTSLDLSSFNTKKVEDMSYMFTFCSALQTIYVNDQKLAINQTFEEDIPSRIVAMPKSEVMVGHTYTVDDFLFYMYYQNGKSEPIYPTAQEAEINPRVADVAGIQTVQIPFVSTEQYGEFGTIETDVTVIDPRDVILEQTWKEPDVHLDLTDDPQHISIQFIKADLADDTNEMLAGAEFTLYAACDIVDRAGNVIVHKDDVIDTLVSGDTKAAYVEFADLPSAVYKKNPTDQYMYYIKETKAPDGYYGNDKVIYCTGEVTSQDKEEFIYTHTSQVDVDEDGNKVFIGDENYLYKNEKIPYVTIKKDWAPYIAAEVPDSLAVTVTLPDGTKKNYTLTAQDNWTVVTDIDANLFAGKTTEQMVQHFVEHNPTINYVEKGSAWDKSTNTYTFVNAYIESIESKVTKVWADGNNIDNIRPASVKMALYQNDVYQKTITLPKVDGSWSHTESRLEAADANGIPYVYTWKEVEEGGVNGNATTGYLPVYTYSTDADGTDITTVTNYHEVDTVEKSIRKEWNDSDNRQQIRPESVNVQLLANGTAVNMTKTADGFTYAETKGMNTVDTITLDEANNWSAKVTDLPLSGDLGDITYTWEEILDEANWITGESTIGYAPKTTVDPLDPDTTILTNTHVYNAGSSVKVNKKILNTNLNFVVGQPTFTFTLNGTDVYGNVQTFEKSITFTETDLASVDADGYITKSVTFENVPYGDYTVTESGMEGIYKQVALTAQTANAALSADGSEFIVKVGVNLEEAKQQAGLIPPVDSK